MGYRVLGPLELDVAGRSVPVRSPTQRALLAVLLVHRGDVVAVDRLVDAVWEEDPPRSAVASLHTYVSRLRKLVGDHLRTREPGYVLEVRGDDVDADRFEALLARARAAAAGEDHGTAVALLDDALGCWRGPAYAEFADRPWAVAEATRLEELRAGAVELRAASLLASGDALAAVAAAEAAVAEHPLREGLWCTLVAALHAAGRQADALRAFQRAAEHLADAGLTPSRALRQAEQAVLADEAGHAGGGGRGTSADEGRPADGGRKGDGRGRGHDDAADGGRKGDGRGRGHDDATAGGRGGDGAEGRRSDHATSREAGSARASLATPVLAVARALPAPPSSFVGRDGEVAALADLAAARRAVTLVGPGGVGKTRLAVEVARRAAPAFGDGVALVELAPLADPEGAPDVVAEALGLRLAVPGSPDGLARAVGDLHVLVLLDNCEHLVDGVARLVDLLLPRCPSLHVLATSRTALGVDGEHVRPVSPLAVDGAAPAARRLFLERAAAAGCGTPTADEDLAAVDEICRRLDGLPLAIEMAAAQLRWSSPRDLAARLRSDLDLLHSPRRAAAARHRTLRAVLEWSVAQLGPADRALLDALGTFAGSWTAHAAAAVAGAEEAADTLDRLGNLVDRSLLTVDLDQRPPRFSMLETVRAYTAARTGGHPDAERWRRRHAEHLAELATEADRGLLGRDEGAWSARLDAELADLREAQRWARDVDPRLASRVVAPLYLWTHNRQLPEVATWARGILAATTDIPHRANLHAIVAAAALDSGDLARGRASAEAAARDADADRDRCVALELLADLATYEGRPGDALRFSGEEAALARRVGDRYHAVIGLLGQALVLGYDGRIDEGLSLMDEAATELDHDAAPSLHAWVAYGRGEVVLDADPAAALAGLNASVALAERVGNRFLAGVARVSIATLQARTGDPVTAAHALTGSIEHWRALGDRTHQHITLRNLVVLLDRLGDHRGAALLLGAVAAGRLGRAWGEEERRLAAIGERTREHLGTAAAADRATLGASMTEPELVAAALEALAAAGVGAA